MEVGEQHRSEGTARKWGNSTEVGEQHGSGGTAWKCGNSMEVGEQHESEGTRVCPEFYTWVRGDLVGNLIFAEFMALELSTGITFRREGGVT